MKRFFRNAASLSIAAAVLAAAGACSSTGTSGGSIASQMQSSKTANVGEVAPDFTLVDTAGNSHTLSDFTMDGKVVVLEWFNPGCPFVVKHYREADRQTMNMLAAEYGDDGVVWLAITSCAPGKQGAGLELNTSIQQDWGMMDRAILLDETGKVGRLYDAKNTPEMFVIDTNGVIRYHGAIDNDRSAASIGNVNYVKDALDAVLADGTVEVPQTRPYGCSVKY